MSENFQDFVKPPQPLEQLGFHLQTLSRIVSRQHAEGRAFLIILIVMMLIAIAILILVALNFANLQKCVAPTFFSCHIFVYTMI